MLVGDGYRIYDLERMTWRSVRPVSSAPAEFPRRIEGTLDSPLIRLHVANVLQGVQHALECMPWMACDFEGPPDFLRSGASQP